MTILSVRWIIICFGQGELHENEEKHIRSINDLTETDQPILSEMIMVAKDMAAQHGVAKSGYRLFINVERGGGQFIFHFHLHLVGGW